MIVAMTHGCARVFAVVGLLTATTQVGSQGAVATFTAGQAQAGAATYQDVCASCHMPDLAGAFEAPQLAGPNFRNMWGGRSVRDLIAYITVAMPPAGEKPSDEGFTNIVAYLLQQNGMEAGDTPLVATADGAISTTPRAGAPSTR